ncbi:hypothetical protein LG329_06485 [Virgibacillus necropolis]|uniref:hypothetical protein n=1 Tax=Virgibacillus necropolis TaxID=163877 RepID=UPI00384AABB1
MAKIDAYYRTENNAESAKAKLETLKVEKVLVERITEPSKSGVIEIMKNLFTVDDNETHDPQVLHVEVAEEDFEEAGKIVQESEGYISKE